MVYDVVNLMAKFSAKPAGQLGMKDDLATSVALVSGAIFWLAVAGVPLLIGITSIAMLALISMFGALLLQLLNCQLGNYKLLGPLLLGPGMSIGVFSLLLVRAGTSKAIFDLVLALIGFALLGLGARSIYRCVSCTRFRLPSISEASDHLWKIPAMVGLIGLILHGEWWWNWPIVLVALVGGIVLLIVSNRKSEPQTIFLATSILVPVMFVVTQKAISMRSRLWWVSSSNDDDPYFEALSHSLVESGPFVDPLIAANRGIAAAMYHHASYFFVGLLDLLQSAEAFITLSRVAPVMLSICAVSTVLFFSEVVSKRFELPNQSPVILYVGVAVFFFAVNIAHPLSDFLGSVVLIGVAAFAVHGVPSHSPIRATIFLTLLIGALVFAKGTYLFAGVMLLTVVSHVNRRSISHKLLPSIIGFAYLVLFAQSSPGSSYRFEFLSATSVGEFSVGNSFVRFLGGVVVVLKPYAIGIVAVMAMVAYAGPVWKAKSIAYGLTSTLSLGVLFGLFAGSYDFRTASYLARPSLLAVGLLVVVMWISVSSYGVSFQSAAVAAVGGTSVFLMWSLIVPSVVPNLNSGSSVAKSLRQIRDPQIVAFILLLLLAVLFVFRYLIMGDRKAPEIRCWLRVLVNPLLVIVLFVVVASFPRLARIEERRVDTVSGYEDLLNDGVVGSEEIRDIAFQLRMRALPNELTAYSLESDDPHRPDSERPFLLAAYSRRNFLHLAGFTKYWGHQNVQGQFDMSASLQMLQTSGSEVMSVLRSREVRYVVLDTNRLVGDWIRDAKTAGAVVLYSNSNFVLLQI